MQNLPKIFLGNLENSGPETRKYNVFFLSDMFCCCCYCDHISLSPSYGRKSYLVVFKEAVKAAIQDILKDDAVVTRFSGDLTVFKDNGNQHDDVGMTQRVHLSLVN